jgi:hypothetical protein
MSWNETFITFLNFRKEEQKRISRSFGNILMPSTSLNLTKTNLFPKLIKFWGRLCFRTRLISQPIEGEFEQKVLERMQECLKVSVWRARFKTFLFTLATIYFSIWDICQAENLLVPLQIYLRHKLRMNQNTFYRILWPNFKKKTNYLESIYQSLNQF